MDRERIEKFINRIVAEDRSIDSEVDKLFEEELVDTVECPIKPSDGGVKLDGTEVVSFCNHYIGNTDTKEGRFIGNNIYRDLLETFWEKVGNPELRQYYRDTINDWYGHGADRIEWIGEDPDLWYISDQEIEQAGKGLPIRFVEHDGVFYVFADFDAIRKIKPFMESLK
jgi:hypothetical protein